jgi:hypothetical protein
MTVDYSILIEETIEQLKELDNFDTSEGYSGIVGYYIDSLEEEIKGAIAKIEEYFVNNFGTFNALFDYLDTTANDGSKSTELILDWDFESILVNGTYTEFVEVLFCIFEDNLPYLLACGLLGAGRGLWEIFDKDFPDLNTLV